MGDIDIYYYVDTELDWISTQHFIIDLCQGVYDANAKLREVSSMIPTKIYGEFNPKFTRMYRRDNLLESLGI